MRHLKYFRLYGTLSIGGMSDIVLYYVYFVQFSQPFKFNLLLRSNILNVFLLLLLLLLFGLLAQIIFPNEAF